MVIKSIFSFQSSDGVEIFAKKWIGKSDKKPKAIIQIAHGMAEHINRYDDFARMLVSQDIFVFGNDHRGHGMTGKTHNSVGYFANEKGFEKVVKDMFTLTTIIEKEYPTVPIFLFGHSMGSFLSRRYIQLYGTKIAGVILSGTGGNPGIAGKIGKLLASKEMKKQGRRTPSPFLNKLTFGSYNKGFRPNRTDFDWLSRDEAEVDKYIADPYCGGIFSAGFFFDLLEGIEIINKTVNIKNIPLELPVYLISGSRDPVGNNSKGVLKTYSAYKKAGIQDVSYQFYDDARHEILNETNKNEVYSDIVQWVDNHLR